ncbi:MAG: class I SAM-dependent methyltransferase [Caldilineaceae bacterium]|nr:class I SAM-dependent methyltransferase [Caldilineaceae bacterium]
MSTYVLMRVLESMPSRYDRGIRLLTRGQLDQRYDWLATHVQAQDHVLDIGCGTGALTLRAAQQGAHVCAIDVNPEMLKIARHRATSAKVDEQVEFRELGVAELDEEPLASYDVILSGLCFSELTADEQRYTLRQAQQLLKAGGLLLIADEVLPESGVLRLLHWLLKAPLATLAYLLTQTTTTAVADLPGQVVDAEFAVEAMQTNRLHDFVALVARKVDGGTR